MATRKPMFLSCVRIDSSNNILRVTNDSVGHDVTITAGVYWLGINGNGYSGGTADASIVSSPASLLETLADAINTKTSESAWNLGLDIDGTDLNFVSTDTGEVAFTAPHNNDALNFSHANTTMDPAWFGATKSAGAWQDATLATAGLWWPAGTMQSTLSFVSDIAIRDDLLRVRHRKKSTKVDSGKRFNVYFGRDVGAREFEVGLSGIPREATNNTYHYFRRWVEHLATSGQSFYYFPDRENAWTAKAWDAADAGGVAYRYGYQRMMPDPETLPFDWDDVSPAYANYYQYWVKRFAADPFVS